ncbi:L,D-transpeptidase [Corynebacterium casei]|uniref:L,D-TPase catalytic domain-containing protein n=1 Tax=Corynebacterium casei LMG S-19264 TaxID=1285583 RepID=A0ABM5PS30_9CORY|nr:Ig-like domain-containing protein [Corynebacterium casei]AHI20803.1 hypothetical protein CCASEI_11245 [Corynebacterium casei LMG S-19264]
MFGLRKINTRRFSRSVVAVAVVAALGLAGCTIDRGTDESDPQAVDAASSDGNGQVQDAEAEEEKLAPEISVEDGMDDHNPYEPVTVTSLGEGLDEVTMTNAEGYVVLEELSEDGMEWSSAETLGFNRTYTVEAKDENGESTSITFKTPEMVNTTAASLSPLPDSEVGVGQTIGVRFGVAIPDREAAQEAISVTTAPEVEGAFYWLNDYEVRWRPKEYWAPGTEVAVEVDIQGVDLGNGVFGSENNETNFTIGDRVTAIVDDATKLMTVYKNGEVLRAIPVSLGKDGGRWATPNGRYIIGDRHESLLMNSETFGYSIEDGGYKTMVNYATQMSYSGIYVHGAPWSEWAQGNTNTSHGCINVTEEAAQWFMNNTKRGDIVLVKNTTAGTLPVYDGLGDWNMSWEEWSAGNA